MYWMNYNIYIYIYYNIIFHHFHHLEFHQLFFALEYHVACLNLGIENENSRV